MTVPSSKDTGSSSQHAENKKGEKTPLLSSNNKSESVLSGRSVRFDEESERRSESQRSKGLAFRSASSYLEHFTQSERDRALKQPGVGKAAFLIRDAVLGDQENPSEGTYNPYENPDHELQNTISIVCRRVCASRPFRKFIYAVAWNLVVLSFIEPPAWCFGIPGIEATDGEAINVGHCWKIMSLRGPPAGDSNSNEDVQYYPNSVFFLLSRTQASIFEWTCLVILAAHYLLLIGRDGCSISRFFRPGRSQLPRLSGAISLVCLVIGLIVAELREGYHTRYRLYFLLLWNAFDGQGSELSCFCSIPGFWRLFSVF